MAALIINGKTFEIPNDSRIQELCESAGVPFNCRSGNCGTCQIEIKDGRENFYPLNKLENDMGMDPFNRLACQCRIKSGTVKISY